MSRPRVRSAALVLLVLVLAVAVGLGGYLVTHAVRRGHSQARPPVLALPSALTAATARPAPAPSAADPTVPSAAAVSAALAKAAADPSLGRRLLGEVVDARTGAVLYDANATTPAAPASTAKLLTAAALLAVRGPTDRIATTVVAGPAGTVVLIGGGDPTLTGAARGKPGAYADAARITDLAAQLRRAHTAVRSIVVDDGLFSGPAVAPGWAPEDIPSDYAAPVTAVLADGGRAAPGDIIRSTTPDLAAGRELAVALGEPALPVSRGRAPSGAAVLARVESAPLAVLVEQMLQSSDNVIAECLGRQVAIAAGDPVSFAGAAAAIRTELTRLGVSVGTGMQDASGLAAADRLSPAALVAVLRLAGSTPAQLHDVVASLPVAGWSGTLRDRYLAGSADAAGAGVVRAKTGTLSGVSALAGLVHDRDGRLLVFAFVADRLDPSASAAPAEAALDGVATVLAGCGCS
ncbi:MAG: D-alanyl-D-alanine carboxypeptidase/D-alanyl-D-alanine endopeptidase [Jatrophihabitantaceae bacterium]